MGANIQLVEGVAPAATSEAIKETIRMVRKAQRQVIADIAATPPDKWKASYLQTLYGQMDASIDRLQRELSTGLNAWTDDSFQKGVANVDRDIATGRVHVGLPDLSRQTLITAENLNVDKITDMTSAARAKIKDEVTQGILAQKSPLEVMRAIGHNLTDPSVFRTIAGRAEAITRTEINRVFSESKQLRQNQAAELIPGLHKRWIYNHFGGPRARIGHMNLHGKTIPVGDQFTVRPQPGAASEQMDHPHAPGASAGNVINCKCTIKVILPEDKDKPEKSPIFPKPRNEFQRTVNKQFVGVRKKKA